MCLHWDISVVAKRSVVWASYPTLARGEGASAPRVVVLRPVLRQAQGCQGEANSVYAETQMVSLSPGCDAVSAVARDSPFQRGTPCLWQHCLCCVLPAKELGLCPGALCTLGPGGVAAHPGMPDKTIDLHILYLKGTVPVKKPEMAETFLLEKYPLITQNVSQ